jgi:ATP-dependent DNA ligase
MGAKADYVHLGHSGWHKRKDSLYESGKRTGAWVKYKVNRGQESVISGYTPGNSFDALIGYYDGERLLYAAKVRNGFVPQLRREVATKFKGLKIDTCPFANLPERKRTQWALTKEEMKNCVWLKPIYSHRSSSPDGRRMVT